MNASTHLYPSYQGKLLYCHPPPGQDSEDFNAENHAAALKTQKKLAPTTRVPATALSYVAPASSENGVTRGSKTEAVDKAFFSRHMAAPSVRGKAAYSMRGGFSRVTMFPHQRMVADDGTPLPQGRRERLMMVQQNAAEAGLLPGKKHKKGKKHVKVRSGAGYDDYS